MTELGLVTNIEIRKNKDGENPRRILQVVISDPDDVQTVEYMSEPGRDSGVMKDDVVLIDEVGSTKYARAADDGIDPDAQEGEEKVYSRDSEKNIAAIIILRTDGTLELNGADDFAVRFSELETAFNSLRDHYNAHTHVYIPGPSGTANTNPITPTSAADISGAKIDTIKTP